MIKALRSALRDLCRPHVLLLVTVPILFATMVWLFLGWLFWADLTAWIHEWLLASRFGRWVAEWAAGALQVAGTVIALALLAPGMMLTALLITELFTMPALVKFVAGHYHPALTRAHGGTLSGSILNTVTAILIFLLLWIVTLPLWFTGVGALVVPALNSAYLNQRVFRYDALSEHANADELRTVIADNRRSLYVLALCLSVLYYVPILNLLVPALTGLAFTHFQLGALEQLRQRQLSGSGNTKLGNPRS